MGSKGRQRLRSAPCVLAVGVASLEADLLTAGCATESERFDALQPTYLHLQETILTSPYAPLALSPAFLEGFESTYEAFVECMGTDGDGLDRRVAELARSAEPTAEELSVAAQFVRCRTETDYNDTYLATLRPVLDDFTADYTAELQTIELEREQALTEARAVLVAHDIEPYTTR